ncbi:MAG: mevalonate kinase [Promethearchaeota archaeon]
MKCTAPGKMILSGEHAVVHGYPSIVTAVSLRTRVDLTTREVKSFELILPDLGLEINEGSFPLLLERTREVFPVFNSIISQLDFDHQVVEPFRVEIRSSIPKGAGLGSSASICACLVSQFHGRFSVDFGRDELLAFSREAERVFHSNPSGVDTTAAINGGTFLYQGGKIIETLDKDFRIDGAFILVNTGIPRNTGEIVNGVKELLERDPGTVRGHFEEMERIVHGIWDGMKLNQLDIVKLGELFTKNHDALKGIGVSIPELDSLVSFAIDNGATGAKLTGAGGGGCAVIACKKDDLEGLMAKLKEHGYDAFQVGLNESGLEQEGCR